MKTLICHTCGCSLVRLGISKDKAIAHNHNDEQLHFCCQGCLELFITDPQKYLKETSDLIVCPTCLTEKPREWAVKLNFSGQEVHFCRCPHCVEAFQENLDYYIQWLEGNIPNEGVLDHEGCCIRPD